MIGIGPIGTLVVTIAVPLQVLTPRFCVATTVTPLSMIATTVELEPPGLMSHAPGMLIAEKFHCRVEYDGSFGTTSRCCR